MFVVRVIRQANTPIVLSYVDYETVNISTQYFVQEPFVRLYSFRKPSDIYLNYNNYINWLHNQLCLAIRKDISFYENNLVEFKILKNFHIFDNNKDNTLYNNIKYIEDNYTRIPLLIELYHVEDETWHLSERNRVGQSQLSKASILFNKIQFLTAIEHLHFYDFYKQHYEQHNFY